jgi:SAM-dependent methyltransferase
MLMPSLKQVAYDPARYIDVETVDEAVDIILCPTEGMTAAQRWNDEAPVLMKIIEQHISPNSSVVDYGCGIGRLAKPLIKKMGCNVVGLDISANMRALATSMVDDPMFAAMDPTMFDLINGYTYDAAIAVWTLQHCLDLEDALERLRRIIGHRGKLILVNNLTRCLPVENGEWADDGLDVHAEIMKSGFDTIDRGKLDEAVAPGWMQNDTFWAAYERT